MSSSPSLFDSFVALFSKNKRAELQAVAERTAALQAHADLVDGVMTAYGPGRFVAYEGNGIARIQLEWGVLFAPLSSVVRLQLVRGPPSIGLVRRDPSSGAFVSKKSWGEAIVNPSGQGVTPLFAFEDEEIRVRTPYGRGQLVGHSRRDGIVRVKLDDKTTSLYTTLEQVVFEEEEEQEKQQQQQQQHQAEAAAADEEEEKQPASSGGASKGKKKKGGK
jgi:hypothetical protein